MFVSNLLQRDHYYSDQLEPLRGTINLMSRWQQWLTMVFLVLFVMPGEVSARQTLVVIMDLSAIILFLDVCTGAIYEYQYSQ